MILFKKLKYKNFLGAGNHYIEISLNENKTNLLYGKNGEGKCFSISTLVKLKNKKTGEIIEITVGDFYAIQEKQNNK